MGRSALPRRHALATPVASGHYAMVTSFSQLSIARSVIHATHSAHSTPGAARHRWALLLRQLGNHRLGGDQQTCDGGRVLQRDARTTLVGSMMPFDTRLPYSPVCAS